MELTLADIGAVLGCSKAAASRLRSGKYERPGSELILRYQALEAVVQKAAAGKEQASLTDLCFKCPRQNCAGCRAAELMVWGEIHEQDHRHHLRQIKHSLAAY